MASDKVAVLDNYAKLKESNLGILIRHEIPKIRVT